MMKPLGSLKLYAITIGALAGCLGVYYSRFLTGNCFIWEDAIFMTYPELSYLATSLASGHFPLWASGMRDGIPLFSQQWVYYPPAWLLSLFVVNGKLPFLAVQWYFVAHLLFGGIAICLFLRGHKLGFGACLAGMVVFVFSAFPTLHIIHGAMGHVYMWLPLELYFVKKVVERNQPGRNSVFLILAIWISFLAGFPQCVLYNALFMGVYWLYLYFFGERAKDVSPPPRLISGIALEGVKIGGVFLMVILLSAVVILPTGENWGQSHRQEFGFAQIADLSLPWNYLIHGVVPNFFGATNGDGSGVPFWGFNRDTIEFRNCNAGYFMYFDFGFYAGQLALLAMAVLAFNFRRLWRERRAMIVFLVALPIVLWLMLGRYGGLFTVFYHVVPGFSMFRSPARIGCLFDFSAAVLVAFLIDALWRGRPVLELKQPLWTLGGIYGVLFLGVLAYGDTVFPELKTQRLMQHALSQLGISVMFFSLMALLLLWIKRLSSPIGAKVSAPAGGYQWRAQAAIGGLVLLTFLDLYLAFHQFHQGRTNPEEYYADRNGLISQMAKLREQQGPFRFAQLRDGRINEEVVFPRNIGYTQQGYEALEGYIMFNLKGFTVFHTITNQRALLDIQNAGVIANSDSRTRQVSLSQYTNSLPRAKFYHDIRAYSDAKALCADLDSGRLDYHRTLGVLAEECAKYGISTSTPPIQANAQIHFTPVSSDEYRISYQTTAPGVIFVSESYYPGWQADGGRYPVIHAFGPFKGIVIPEAGSGVITVKFSPRTLWLGLAISGVTLGLLLAALVLFVRRDRGCQAKEIS
jgi:hypothetical protein